MSLPQLTLGLRLGDLNSPSLQRLYLHRQLCRLEHNTAFNFNYRTTSDSTDRQSLPVRPVAHQSGTACIAIDQTQGRYLVSGGADTAIRLWDLEAPPVDHDDENEDAGDSQICTQFQPVSSLSKVNPDSHTHAITSISIYPHDPIPSTFLSTSFDNTILVSTVTTASLVPVHRFPLDYAVYTHALSPHPSSSTSSLIATGTAHPSVRLLDLRSGLSTHSLPGHQGSIWTVTWHPRQPHVLLSAGTDGRILFFDIRRAAPAFASLDADDSLGFLADPSRPLLSYTHRAHSGPITGITFVPDSSSSSHHGDLLLSASHDSRLRLWNTSTLANSLAHFGPRIRNSRTGNLAPLPAPASTACGEGTKRGSELVFWPNDDGRGEIFVSTVREGESVNVMQMQHINSNSETAQGDNIRAKKTRIDRQSQAASRLTAAKRINTMAFRPVHAHTSSASGGVELYTGHGDGGIHVWTAKEVIGVEIEDEDESVKSDTDVNAFVSRIGAGSRNTDTGRGRQRNDDGEQQGKRKRKREVDLVGLVAGLSRKGGFK